MAPSPSPLPIRDLPALLTRADAERLFCLGKNRLTGLMRTGLRSLATRPAVFLTSDLITALQRESDRAAEAEKPASAVATSKGKRPRGRPRIISPGK